MTRTFTSRMVPAGLAVAVVAGMVVALPGAAFAASGATSTSSATTSTLPSNPFCTPALFSAAQQRVEADLSARVAQLQSLQTSADNAANHLTAGDRQTLQNDVTNVELPGIQGLQTQAQQSTTCPALRQTAHAMVFTYRVYIVMTPQTHLTIVADDETYVEEVFVNLEPTIAQAIANAQSQGKNVAAAQSAFSDLKTQVSNAQSATSGQSATLLAQTPQGAPGNWPVFLSARTSLTNAHTDLHTAYSDAQQIRADLQ